MVTMYGMQGKTMKGKMMKGKMMNGKTMKDKTRKPNGRHSAEESARRTPSAQTANTRNAVKLRSRAQF